MSRNDTAIVRNPKTGTTTYRLKGEEVNKETFYATAFAQTIMNVFVIFALAKGLGISKRRAWAIVAAANGWRAMNDMRVDIEGENKPLASVDAFYRR